MTLSLKIPKELTHPFFYSEGETILFNEDELLFFETPFIYEIAYYNGITTKKPWEEPFEMIPLLLNKWEVLDKKIHVLFEKRSKKEVIPLMELGVGLFIQFLYWLNQRPVQLIPSMEVSSLKIQPINLEERLQFIIDRPSIHHSYKQLKELMIELEKRYGIEKARMKINH